jgi:integrase
VSFESRASGVFPRRRCGLAIGEHLHDARANARVRLRSELLQRNDEDLARAQRRPDDGRRRRSLLLQQCEAIQYVQRMLGHASITLTVDTYGKWLPMGNNAAVDRLDETPTRQGGGKLVAEVTKRSPRRSQVVGVIGDPGRARTFNPEIKSLLLYH